MIFSGYMSILLILNNLNKCIKPMDYIGPPPYPKKVWNIMLWSE